MKTAILNAVFRMTEKGSAMILAVLLLRFLLRDYSKKIAYFAWLPVGICLLVPWQIPLPLIPAAAGTIRTPAPVLNTVHTIGTIAAGTANVSTSGGNGGHQWLFWVWAAGVAIMTCYTLIQYLRLISGISKAEHMKGNQYIIRGAESPFAFGLVHPKIYLPANISEADRWCILKHEKVHIRRHDGLFKLFGHFALCIHFFNPLVWIAFHCFENDMEMSCDEEAVRTMNEEERTQYAESLVNAATDLRTPLVSSFSNQKKEVSKRVKNLFINKKNRTVTIISIAAIVVLAAFVSFKLTTRKDTESDAALTFRSPFDAPEVTCGYGCTTGHNGEDLISSNSSETKIKAVADGTVIATGTDAALGNWIILSHPDDWYSFYAALGSVQGNTGDDIKAGQTIGVLGLSGASTGPHVHLAIRQFKNDNDYLNHFLSTGNYPDDIVYQFYEGVVPADNAAAPSAIAETQAPDSTPIPTTVSASAANVSAAYDSIAELNNDSVTFLLSVYQGVLLDTFGAEVDTNASFVNDGTSYFKVQNYTSVDQIKQYISQYVDSSLYSDVNITNSFLEKDGALYLIRTVMGYGANDFDPTQWSFLSDTSVQVQYVVLGDPIPGKYVTVEFENNNGWKISSVTMPK